MEDRAVGQVRAAGPLAEPLSVNALQLTPREWLFTAAGVLALLVAFPACRARMKSPALEEDYRVPYALTHHHEHYERYSTLAVGRFDVFLVGDSVVWGQFCDRDQTLAHHLNRQAGGNRFANLGLDGMHPIALAMLLERDAPSLVGKRVVLQCNPLWYLSLGRRRTGEEGLASGPDPAAPGALGPSAIVERIPKLLTAALADVPILKALHRRAAEYSGERLEILAWTLEHPYENPFHTFSFLLPPPEHRAPLSRGAPQRPRGTLEGRWDALPDSPQWISFQRVVEILEGRGNQVFIVVGPINEEILTPSSRADYQTVKAQIIEWCRATNRPFAAPDPLPFELYADICHPTGAGYAELARRLREAEPRWFAPELRPR